MNIVQGKKKYGCCTVYTGRGSLGLQSAVIVRPRELEAASLWVSGVFQHPSEARILQSEGCVKTWGSGCT